MTTSLTTTTARGPSQAVALPINTMAELERAGAMLAKSGMFGINNDQAGFVVAATCHQQGISLLEFNRTYHIVEGRPSMRADAMLAEFRNRGGRYEILENSTTRAAAVFEFDNQRVTFEFTSADAARTGDCFKADGKTFKHNWAHRPDDMLWARMVSRAVRRLCPEIVAGLYTPEEAADFGDRPERAPGAALDQDEAVRRAKAVVPEVEPATVDAPTAEPGDATKCPAIGCPLDGVPWTDMDRETLEAALEISHEAMRPAHFAAIRLALETLTTEGGAQ